MQRTTRIAGFRASSIRRICEHCKTQFRPARSDAKFCCNLCRQAASHKRKEVASVKEAAAVFEKRQKEALEVITEFDRFQGIAVSLHAWAQNLGLDGIKCMGTQMGIVVATDADCPQWRGFLSTMARGHLPRWFREIKTRSDDRELRALISIPAPGVGSYIVREVESECRALLNRGPIDVSLFVEDWDNYRATHEPVSLPTWPDWMDELDRDFADLDAVDLMPIQDDGGVGQLEGFEGFRVFLGSKGDK